MPSIQQDLQTVLLLLLAEPRTDERMGGGVHYLAEAVRQQFHESRRVGSQQIMEAYSNLVVSGLAYEDRRQPATENHELRLTEKGRAAVPTARVTDVLRRLFDAEPVHGSFVASQPSGGPPLRAGTTTIPVSAEVFRDLTTEGLIEWELKEDSGRVSAKGRAWLDRGGPPAATAVVEPGPFPPFSIADARLRERVEDLIRAERAYDRAILQASVVLEDRVREVAGLGTHTYGVALMTDAFKPLSGRLRLSTVPAEQEGAMHVYRGTIAFFRNPSGHRVVEHYSQEDALRFVAWVDLLLRLLDQAEPNTATRSVSTPAT